MPPISYRLLLSAPAESIAVDTGKSAATEHSGTLELDPANPYVGLSVHWKSAPAADEHRFAKLTVAIPGQETFVHVFDAAGDIDDLVELPLPTAAP